MRGAKAAAAARAVADYVAWAHVQRHLGAQPVRVPIRVEDVLGDTAGLPAEESPRTSPISVGQNREGGRPLWKEVVLAEAQSAPELARALGVRDQLVPQDAHRVVALGLLDRGVLGVLAMRLHGVGPIASGAAAVASAQGLEVAVVVSGHRVGSAEARVAHH